MVNLRTAALVCVEPTPAPTGLEGCEPSQCLWMEHECLALGLRLWAAHLHPASLWTPQPAPALAPTTPL